MFGLALPLMLDLSVPCGPLNWSCTVTLRGSKAKLDSGVPSSEQMLAPAFWHSLVCVCTCACWQTGVDAAHFVEIHSFSDRHFG